MSFGQRQDTESWRWPKDTWALGTRLDEDENDDQFLLLLTVCMLKSVTVMAWQCCCNQLSSSRSSWRRKSLKISLWRKQSASFSSSPSSSSSNLKLSDVSKTTSNLYRVDLYRNDFVSKWPNSVVWSYLFYFFNIYWTLALSTVNVTPILNCCYWLKVVCLNFN